MTKIRIVADVHGKMEKLFHLCQDSIGEVDRIIQVGDMGIAPVWTNAEEFDWMFEDLDIPIHMIRGNHDAPEEISKSSHYIKDGTFEIINGVKIMYIGGALSIDRHIRQEGLDWWPDEELSYEELYHMITDYSEFKPDIMITHEST